MRDLSVIIFSFAREMDVIPLQRESRNPDSRSGRHSILWFIDFNCGPYIILFFMHNVMKTHACIATWHQPYYIYSN